MKLWQVVAVAIWFTDIQVVWPTDLGNIVSVLPALYKTDRSHRGSAWAFGQSWSKADEHSLCGCWWLLKLKSVIFLNDFCHLKSFCQYSTKSLWAEGAWYLAWATMWINMILTGCYKRLSCCRYFPSTMLYIKDISLVFPCCHNNPQVYAFSTHVSCALSNPHLSVQKWGWLVSVPVCCNFLHEHISVKQQFTFAKHSAPVL